MARITFAAALLLSGFGLGPYEVAPSAVAQDGAYNLDIRNRSQVPIVVRRMGRSVQDVDEVEIGPGLPGTLQDIPMQSDQVISAWSTDDANKCFGIYKCTSDNRATLSVTENGFVAALAPPGAGRTNGPGGNTNRQRDVLANNLGIYYTPIRQADGSFHLRITRPPAADSPAAQLGFEVNDVITALDDQPFRTPQNVLEHSKETTVDFIDCRTKEARRGTLQLP